MDCGTFESESSDFKKITWTIPVECFNMNESCTVPSPSFSFANATWKFELHPHGQIAGETKGFSDLLIVRLDSRIPEHYIFYEFCLKSPSGTEYDRWSGNRWFNSDFDEEIKRCMHKSKIFTRHCIEDNSSLTISCEMQYVYNENGRCSQLESDASLSDSSIVPHHPVTLSEFKTLSGIKELFLKQEDSDLTLKVKGQEFPSHKAILTARSSVFAAMLKNDTEHKVTSVIDIEDCIPSSFSDFLHYLYCGEVNLSMGNVFNLYSTAYKYNVQDLRSECMELLKKNLCLDTFCDIATLAQQLSDKELIELTIDFLGQHFQEIIVFPKWQSFILENPAQSNELVIKALKLKYNS